MVVVSAVSMYSSAFLFCGRRGYDARAFYMKGKGMNATTKPRDDQLMGTVETYYVPEFEASVQATSVAEAVERAKRQAIVNKKEDK